MSENNSPRPDGAAPDRASPANDAKIPLCVDLDGTLIRTDLLWESLVSLLKRNLLYAFALPWWLLVGRANLKRQIASRTDLDLEVLPYNKELMSFLHELKAAGRRLVLVTAAEGMLAHRVAGRLGLFDEVLCSDGQTNLRGTIKAQRLVNRFGKGGFDYVGDSRVDLPVWENARAALVVTRSGSGLEQSVGKVAKILRIFQQNTQIWKAMFKAIRLHQWVKNLIIFVPLVAAHEMNDVQLVLYSLRAFIAFGLTASAVYVLNDLLDLDSDRHHARKRRRPFASGDLSIAWGVVMVPVLAVAGLAIAFSVGPAFEGTLIFYIVLTTAYSHAAKRAPLLDVFVLAALYTVRLIAGHAVTGLAYSNWLLMFSLFIFLSLALAKRFVEVFRSPKEASVIRGRGYTPSDSALLGILGVGNGLLAVLVLALYANSMEVSKLYQHPTLLLLMCPLLLYWISRVWLLAYRGQLHEDPVVFALKDRGSYLLGLTGLLIIWLASGHGSLQ